jgi:His-Xaa-Ser system protein HxsD
VKKMSVETEAPRVESVGVVVRDGTLILLVDETVYSREAVLRTCYWFTDRCYLFVSRAAPERLVITVRAKPGGLALETVGGEFTNALLDQQLRLEIGQETQSLRQLIVAKAFAASGVLEDPPVGDDRDPVELARAARGPTFAGKGGHGSDE